MKKTIKCLEVCEIDLQFNSGEIVSLKFDTEAIANLNNLEDGLAGYINEKSLPEQCAKIIYIGAVSGKSDFTIEKARTLVSELSPITITEIVNEFSESMGASKSEVQKEVQKKLMEQFTKTTMK